MIRKRPDPDARKVAQSNPLFCAGMPFQGAGKRMRQSAGSPPRKLRPQRVRK